MTWVRASVYRLRTDNGENWENPNECKFWKHDDAMHMMTWWNATRKQMTWQQQRKIGRHLAHQSRAVTTLHHYERISSRDLEWHQREKRRRKSKGKLSFFFDECVKPKNLARLNKFDTEYTEGEQGQKHSFRKEEQRTLRKNLEVEGQDKYWNHSG